MPLVQGPLPPFVPDDDRREDGAELLFHGRVRATEHGRPIASLDYEYYPEMAERELARLSERATARFDGVSELRCWHRVGEVPVGHASLRVVVWSRHRAEGLACLAWFIDRLKRDVPIWKWAVTEQGERFPSRCDHEHASHDEG
jgi:molybdopterin synthase catalytic subunit